MDVLRLQDCHFVGDKSPFAPTKSLFSPVVLLRDGEDTYLRWRSHRFVYYLFSKVRLQSWTDSGMYCPIRFETNKKNGAQRELHLTRGYSEIGPVLVNSIFLFH